MQLVPFKKNISQKFDFKNPPFDPIEFAQEFVKFMYDSNGLSLAAIQIGVPYNIFAMRGSPQNFVCFNPRIVNIGEENIMLEESSLTYPGLIVKIKRPKNIKVRFQTPNGETLTQTYHGITSRTFQHNMDFLNGINFYVHANPIHRSQALKKYNRTLE
jgi:peptide deformylase